MKSIKMLIAALIAVTAIAANSMAISLTEYTFPTSISQDAFLSGAYNLNGTSQDSTQVGYNFSGAANYNLFYRSLPFSYQLSFSGDFYLRRATPENAAQEDGYNLNLSSRANRYFKDTGKLFGFGSNRIQYQKLSGVVGSPFSEGKKPYIDVTVGIGYGRSINATVLKQAIRMSEDFKRFGVTTGDLPDEALLKLARIIDRKSEFQATYGTVEYRKYWYNAMEDVLREANVLKEGGLGAMGVVRIQEVLDEPTGQRIYGWEVRAGAGVVLSDYQGKSGDPLATLEYDWSRPISIKTQVNNNFIVSTVFTDDSTQIYKFTEKFQVYYELSNRIHWDNTLNFEYRHPSEDNVKKYTSINLSSAFQFYIENQLTFNPSFILRRLDDGVNDAVTDWAFTGGITYRLR
ncbi:MAG: hypothetical protein OEM52_14130 [bacterium]|nr:hypothetical protein [bacterium]